MKIKNWSRFQHYKKKYHPGVRLPWIKLYGSLLNDPDWHELSGADSKCLVGLWMLSSETNGELPDLKRIAFRLRMTVPDLSKSLSRLTHWIDTESREDLDSVYSKSTQEKEEEKDKERKHTRSRARVPFPENWAPEGTKIPEGANSGDPEFLRFKNHAIANGRLCAGIVGWEAAWRNWMTSPFRQQSGSAGGQAARWEAEGKAEFTRIPRRGLPEGRAASLPHGNMSPGTLK